MRVLVVDDDPAIRKTLARALAKIASVATASGFANAQRRLAQERFDVVVTDNQMPDGSGRALLAVVHERCPETRCLLISGQDPCADGEPIPSWVRFLRKPFAIDALFDALK